MVAISTNCQISTSFDLHCSLVSPASFVMMSSCCICYDCYVHLFFGVSDSCVQCPIECRGSFDGLSMSSLSSLTLSDKNQYNKELREELDAIDSQYNECFQELLRRREEAIENAKKRWYTRKVAVA